jgi:peptidoglycan/LPS O-acetylase OafA/YrhL
MKSNPLLPLWSLGVEEQFYIFWPCLISIGLKFFEKKTLFIISLYTALSFIFNIVCTYKSGSFAFLFPLCRFWEMAIGGIIAYLDIKLQKTIIKNILSIFGAVSIMIAIWFMKISNFFPGFWALLPSISAAAIIQAGP